MKRSDMVKALAKEFYALTEDEFNELTSDIEQLVSKTIELLESKGMLPPGYWTDWDREHEAYVNEWESEQ